MSPHPPNPESGTKKLPSVSRRALALAAIVAALWCALAWHLVEGQARAQISEVVDRQTREAREAAYMINVSMDGLLNRLQGLAAVMAADSRIVEVLAAFGPQVQASARTVEARKTEWTQRPDLKTANERLLIANTDMDVDVIWAMNANGDCVVSSNHREMTSFIGTNYADRTYFAAARSGRRARQYAVGRVTNVPGLFFSAPITANGAFVGAVAVKSDLTRIASAINHRHAFITDDYGVIILAADRTLEMRALPGAAVHQLSDKQRMSRYVRTKFETLDIQPDRLLQDMVRVSGSPHLHAAALSELPHHGITVHIVAPIEHLKAIREQTTVLFMLLAASGILFIALALGAYAYLARVRQNRVSMEAANASLQALNQHLDHLSKIDALTGCANRRHFQARLEAEILRADRYGHPCSVLSADIDFFKRVNDQYGHAAGDEALRHFSNIVRQKLRSEDELGRLGGEEFAVMLPETGLSSALAAAERIRRALESNPAVSAGNRLPITASFGVACSTDGESSGALLGRADAALYRAKEGGRNRVVPSLPPSRSAAAMPQTEAARERH